MYMPDIFVTNIKKKPYVINIEKETSENDNFRKVLNTMTQQQLVVMSIKPKDNIPFEIHPKHDQFIRIERGTCTAFIGENKEDKYELSDGFIIMIPAGTWHEIVNTSDTELKLYTIYSPPEHPPDKIEHEKPEQSGGRIYSQNSQNSHDKYKRKYFRLKNFKLNNFH